MGDANSTIKVLFLNNSGGGFARYVDVPAGTTVGGFFLQELPNQNPGAFTIKLNRELVAADVVLKEGDKLSVVPKKVEGA